MGANALKLVAVLAAVAIVGLSGLIAQSSSHPGEGIFQGPRPVYTFDSAEFVVRDSSNVFTTYNSTLLITGQIYLDGRRLNETHVEVEVVVTGVIQYPKPGSNLTFSNVYVLERGMGPVIPQITGVAPNETPKEFIGPEELEEIERIYESIESSPFEATYTFIVDTRYNYAYIDGEPIGFFPLYSFIDIKYEEAADYKFTYLGSPLELEMSDGVPQPQVIRFMGSEFTALSFENEFAELLIVHNYMAIIRRLVLPVGDGIYIIFSPLTASPEVMSYIESISDYPTSVRVDSLREEAAILGALAALALFLAVRKRRAR